MPLTAAALPEVSADFKRFVFTLQRGNLFADDPVFKGRPRELMAADYVYSFKRFYDPLERTEHLHRFENAKILGLSELRSRALEGKSPFPYDVEVPGLRAARASSELWLKRLRVVFEFAPFGELIKRSLAGQLMMWGFSWGAP